MDLEYLKSQIGNYNIECIWKTGSQVYSPSRILHDLDYVITIENWDQNFYPFFKDGIDYFCYDKTYWNNLCNNYEEYQNKLIFFEEYINFKDSIVYGSRTDHLKLLEDPNRYLSWLKDKKNEWLLDRHFIFEVGRYMYHNLIFVLIPYYWIQNKSYVLTNEQQNIIDRLHDRVVEKWEIMELINLI